MFIQLPCPTSWKALTGGLETRKIVGRLTPLSTAQPCGVCRARFCRNTRIATSTLLQRLLMNEKILVVDDERHIRMLYQEELQADGYIITVSDGREPIMDVIAREKPQLVILDIKLEGNPATGLDLLQTIRASDTVLPVILSTAYDSFQHDLKSIAADAYNVKSVDLTLLKDTIKRVLAQKS
jgi:CheY-like chemotaxis protein